MSDFSESLNATLKYSEKRSDYFECRNSLESLNLMKIDLNKDFLRLNLKKKKKSQIIWKIR